MEGRGGGSGRRLRESGEDGGEFAACPCTACTVPGGAWPEQPGPYPGERVFRCLQVLTACCILSSRFQPLHFCALQSTLQGAAALIVSHFLAS